MIENGQLNPEESNYRPTVDGPDSPQPNQQILEEVLQKTISEYSDSSTSEEDIKCLRRVADKYRGQDLDARILRDLVGAMLGRVFEQPMNASWKKMANTIAESMLEDPTALLRIEQLWKRI